MRSGIRAVRECGRRTLLLVALATAAPVAATTFSFDFNTMGYRSSSTPGSNSAVQSYLTGIWNGVTVTGAGELSNNQYTGDGHVVGPATCTRTDMAGACTNWSVTPATLGSTEGGVGDTATVNPISSTNPDNFIVNYGADRIVITFPEPIYFVSFDYEIFPDGTCPSLANCGGQNHTHLPDFTFLADDITYFHSVGVLPGTSSTYPHSTASHGTGNEPAPQLLDVSGDWFFADGVTTLAFVDWPERIGIDNLVVDTQCSVCPHLQVPEPPTLPIVALGLGLLGLMLRRQPRRIALH